VWIQRAEAAEDVLSAPKVDEQVRLHDIFEFRLPLWLICASCVIVYCAVLPFNNVAGDFLQIRYGYDTEVADRILAIPFFISAFASPFLGGFVDLFGRRATLMYVAAGVVLVVHATFAFTHITPYPEMVVLGIAYSVYAAAIWPSVPLVVEERSIGTAYGVITAMQNAGLATVPLLVGYIKDATGSYHAVELFFASLGAAGVLVGLVLNWNDGRTGRVLNKSHLNKPADDPQAAVQDGGLTNVATGSESDALLANPHDGAAGAARIVNSTADPSYPSAS